MALADRLDGPVKRPSGLPCSMAEVMAQLPDVELKALENALYVAGASATVIHEALRAEGFTVGKQTVNRHRSRACRCYL